MALLQVKSIAKLHRDPLQVRIATMLHVALLQAKSISKLHRNPQRARITAMLQIGSLAKSCGILWQASSTAELYRVFERKTRKALEVRVKIVEPRMRTSKIMVHTVFGDCTILE
jgi:hypothetical protein